MKKGFSRNIILKGLWRSFISVKLAISLIIVIAIISIIGTIIPQEDVMDISRIKETYSPNTYNILESLGLFKVFHSWIFIAAMALLSINLILCSLNQLPGCWKLIRNPKNNLDYDSLQRLKNKDTIMLPKKGSTDNIILPAFKKYHLKPHKKSHKGKYWFFAQKHSFSRFGHLFTHWSIVIILLGVMISSLFSFKGYLGLIESESSDTFILHPQEKKMPLDFTVRADRCQVIYYKNNPQMEKDWLTTLTILEEGNPRLTKTIEVNHPLKYKGIYFYQESFIPNAAYEIKRLLLSLEKKGQRQSRREYAVNIGDSIKYNGFTIKVLQFYPDLIIEDGKAKSKTNQLNNPAVKTEILSPKGKTMPLWVFAMHPLMHRPKDLDIEIRLNVEANFYNWTRLQVVRDPGIPLVWVGCTLLAFAVIATFYFSHQRYWAYITIDKSGRTFLNLAGSTHRNQPVFVKHFEALVKEIKSQIKKAQKN